MEVLVLDVMNSVYLSRQCLLDVMTSTYVQHHDDHHSFLAAVATSNPYHSFLHDDEPSQKSHFVQFVPAEPKAIKKSMDAMREAYLERFMFHDNIDGAHNDKAWLEQARTCMKNAVSNDTFEMNRFGGDTPYISSLKELLKKYDPAVSYWMNKRCSEKESRFSVCANRQAFLMFFHDNVKFKGNADAVASYTPTRFELSQPSKISKARTKLAEKKANRDALGRATKAGQGLFFKQFRSWLSSEEYTILQTYRNEIKKQNKNHQWVNAPPDIYSIYQKQNATLAIRGKPDFLSPVPPYPEIYTSSELDHPRGMLNNGAPLGWTQNKRDSELDSVEALLETQLAHIVDSGEWKWIQYLVNALEAKTFWNIQPEDSIIQIKQKFARMSNKSTDPMWLADDKDPNYYTPDTFEAATSQRELWNVDLYVVDSAANILNLNKRAHHLLFDKWMKSDGSPNMSANLKHGFFTVDCTGQVHGVAQKTLTDGEFMGYAKGQFLPCGVANHSKINAYWYDCSDAMFEQDRVQWLQNYRRKRWTQIRNILYAFMIEANTDPTVDRNDISNVCNSAAGCQYKRNLTLSSSLPKQWTSQYDAEMATYLQVNLPAQAVAAAAGSVATRESKQARPTEARNVFHMPVRDDKISIVWNDGVWYSGTIIKVTTGKYNVRYEDNKIWSHPKSSFGRQYYQVTWRFVQDKFSTKTAVISADFDGCWDILFSDMTPYYEANYPGYDIEEDRKELIDELEKIERKHDRVILLVGSSRQTPGEDKTIRNMMNIRRPVRFDTRTNQNLCFHHFARLAEQRKWTFLDEIQFPDEYKLDKTKIHLLDAQLDAMKKYVGGDFEFYFFDNDSKIIDKLKEVTDDKPKIHIIKFEWESV